jgi:hypothetical protein
MESWSSSEEQAAAKLVEELTTRALECNPSYRDEFLRMETAFASAEMELPEEG